MIIYRHAIKEDLPELCEVLNQLSPTTYNESSVQALFSRMNKSPDYYVMVADDHSISTKDAEGKEKKGKIVGTATLLIQSRFSRECEQVAHVEDVVVDKQYRAKGVGKKLVEELLKVAEDMGASRAKLSCSKENMDFYKKIGFRHTEMSMRFNFNSNE